MLSYLINDMLVEKNDRIAVGVSGGVDSMVLLWALIGKQKKIGFYLKVINVNHHLRGAESDGDSKFVADFCKKQKIDYVVADADVLNLQKDKKLTLEESARIARYKIFEDEMKKSNLNKLFLAHHKNDQVETILMHIFRGSGISGACGIKNSDRIIRPLLNLSKTEILQIAVDYGVKFVVDSSNSDNKFTRNYIRNIVIPTIEKIYPNIIDSVFMFGERNKEIQNFIENSIDYKNIIQEKDYILLKELVFSNDKFIVREYIKVAFSQLGIFADIESKHYDIIFNLFNSETNKVVDLPHNTQALRTLDGIKFYKKRKNKITNTKEYVFCLGETQIFGIGTIKVEFVDKDSIVYGGNKLYVDYAKISSKAVWRNRKIGDVFSKLGSGSKKLNDYFTDKKFEMTYRDMLPILAVDNIVLVVANHDISESVKIDSDTDTVVSIEFLLC